MQFLAQSYDMPNWFRWPKSMDSTSFKQNCKPTQLSRCSFLFRRHIQLGHWWFQENRLNQWTKATYHNEYFRGCHFFRRNKKDNEDLGDGLGKGILEMSPPNILSNTNLRLFCLLPLASTIFPIKSSFVLSEWFGLSPLLKFSIG